MTKVLKCRDVGVDCDFEARATTVEEVLEKAKEHACQYHGFSNIPPELVERVKSMIKDEDAASA